MIVRPDQYVAHVLPLAAHAEITGFFAGVLREQNGSASIDLHVPPVRL